MATGIDLLLAEEYKAALTMLRSEAARDKQDDFQAGSSMMIGSCLMLLGKFSETNRHLHEIRTKAWRPVSGHLILLGISSWFQGRREEAVKYWQDSEKCQYHGDGGTDTPRMLYFAAVRDPGSYAIDVAKEKLVELNKGLYENDYPSFISRYICDMIGEDEFTSNMCRWNGKNAQKWIPGLTALAGFYVGLKSLEKKNDAEFRSQFGKCAGVRKAPNFFDEYLIARLEQL